MTSADIRTESDGELVRLANKGNQDAWNEVVHRFGWMVHRVARRSGLSDSDAADATQFTWLRLMANLDEIRDPSRVAAWLATTARRESLRLAIAGRRQIPFADPASDCGWDGRCCTAVDADTEHLLGDYGTELGDAINRLPEPYQRLVRLLYSDAGPTYAEVSEALDLPIGSIGPMRQRALLLLRRTLETAATRGRFEMRRPTSLTA